jgi:MSHA biogenesis protein MshE
MGIESYLVASSLSAVIAQRLIRQVCKRCAVSYTPSALECNVLERAGFRQGETPSDFRIGTGCVQCFDSGYRGRIGVFEILEIDHRVAGALRANDIGAFHQAVNEQPGYRPIWKNALQLALSGQTSITEALKYSDMSQFGEPSEAPQSGDLVA